MSLIYVRTMNHYYNHLLRRYIHKEIGELVSEEPFTVRLKFEPAGRAVGDVGKFYQQEKANQCVACGRTDSYQRKNIIPREYRRFFPRTRKTNDFNDFKRSNNCVFFFNTIAIMKDHTSHDILLLCPTCHQRSNISDLSMRHKLAKLADAPFNAQEGGARLIEQPDLKFVHNSIQGSCCSINFFRRRLKSAAKALHQHGSNIPEKRMAKLLEVLVSHFPAETKITEELIKETSEITT